MKRVRQSEAARRLGVNRSTVSRWVKRNPDLEDQDGFVSIEELSEFRNSIVNPIMRSDPLASSTPTKSVTSLNDHRARREEARAELEELQLAEKRSLILRRSDVEAKLAAAGTFLRQHASHLARDHSERLALISDVREMERALDGMMRDFLAAAARALDEAAAGTVEKDAI